MSGLMELPPSTGMKFRSYSTQPKPRPIRRSLAPAAVADEVPRHVTQHPLGSLLLLADFSRSVFTKETVEHLKLAAVFDRPHIKKSAWVLTQNLPKTLYESVLTFSGREIATFETREEALEYLVAE